MLSRLLEYRAQDTEKNFTACGAGQALVRLCVHTLREELRTIVADLSSSSNAIFAIIGLPAQGSSARKLFCLLAFSGPEDADNQKNFAVD